MFEKKRMAETSEIAHYAIDSGIVEGKEDIIVLEDNVNRICAPESPHDQNMWAIILWTKTTRDDHDPQPQKIVCLLSDCSKYLKAKSCLSLELSFMDLSSSHHIFIKEMMCLPLRQNQI